MKHNLDELVNNISGLISQSINIMDDNGIIISSSDSERVGDFHAVAKELIDGNEQISVTRKTENGVRPGVNIVVKINGVKRYVAGVTGDPDEVSVYGKIVSDFIRISVEHIEEQDEISRIESISQAVALRVLYGFEAKNTMRQLTNFQKLEGKHKFTAFKFKDVSTNVDSINRDLGSIPGVIHYSYFRGEDKIIGFVTENSVQDIVLVAKKLSNRLLVGNFVSEIDKLYTSYSNLRLIEDSDKLVTIFSEEKIAVIDGILFSNKTSSKIILQSQKKLLDADSDALVVISEYVKSGFKKAVTAEKTFFHLNTIKNKLDKYAIVLELDRRSAEFKVMCYWVACQK